MSYPTYKSGPKNGQHFLTYKIQHNGIC